MAVRNDDEDDHISDATNSNEGNSESESGQISSEDEEMRDQSTGCLGEEDVVEYNNGRTASRPSPDILIADMSTFVRNPENHNSTMPSVEMATLEVAENLIDSVSSHIKIRYMDYHHYN